jgi:L-fuconolactonase
MIMRIDAHQHFWIYRPETHGWITDAMAVLKRDFLPTDLEPLLRGQGFDGCVAVQAAQSLEETRFLLGLADRHPFVKAVVGWVDLLSPDLEAQLGAFVSHPCFRGVRHIAQDEPDDRWLARDDVVHGVAALQRFGLTYDILVYARQLPAAIELARRLPDQPFVVDHIAKPEIRAARLDPWRADIRRLAVFPGVRCKLSGLATEAAWDRWKPSDIRPYLDVVLEAFGPGRLMIGSDWPVCLLAGDYPAVIGLVREFIGALSAAEQAAILGENAARFYGIAGTIPGGTS